MSRHSLIPRVGCALAFACLFAGPAHAQATRVIGPFAGLFGGDKGERSQSLDIRGSLFGGYNRDIITGADAATVADLGLGQSGGDSGADLGMSYRRRGPRVHFDLEGSGAFQVYAANSLGGASYSAASNLTASLSPKVAFGGHAELVHTPYYQFGPSLTPDSATNPVLLTPGYGIAAASQATTSWSESVSVTDNFSKRSNVSADAHLAQTRFGRSHASGNGANGEAQNFDEFGASLSFQHRISRPLAFHLGYGREQLGGPSSSSTSPVVQSVDVGLDYADVLSFARKTKLSFALSTAFVRAEGATDFRVDGNLRLSRAFARTWQTSLEYVRATEFIPGFTQPLLSDAVSASVGGLIAPRVNWIADAGYSFGHVGFGDFQSVAASTGAVGSNSAAASNSAANSNSFGVFAASTTLQSGITRMLGVFVNYSFYRYRVPIDATGLPLLPTYARHAVTAGLSANVPIIRPRGEK